MVGSRSSSLISSRSAKSKEEVPSVSMIVFENYCKSLSQLERCIEFDFLFLAIILFLSLIFI